MMFSDSHFFDAAFLLSQIFVSFHVFLSSYIGYFRFQLATLKLQGQVAAVAALLAGQPVGFSAAVATVMLAGFDIAR